MITKKIPLFTLTILFYRLFPVRGMEKVIQINKQKLFLLSIRQ